MSYEGGDWVCLSWPLGVCLSLYLHSFGLLLLLSHLCLNSFFLHSFGLLLLLSHLCLNSFFLHSFVSMLWSLHMAHSSNTPNVCLLSPLCLNFTLFFWCFGICIWCTLQMHPMLHRSLGSTRSLNFFVICQRIGRRDQKILIFCLWQSFFG
jgi:hypothetical protein